jgi:hypothetical protein
MGYPHKAVDVREVKLPAAVYGGQKTVATAGTAEALAASQEIEAGVQIKALSGNGGNVYVGGSGVDSSSGFVLAAGEEIFVEVDDLAAVYLDVDSGGEGVSYIAS